MTMTTPTLASARSDDYVVDFHTMWIVPAWIRRHCVIPDRFEAGNPYIPADWQDWYFVNFYRVRSGAPEPADSLPGHGGPRVFYYRRAQVVMPQKAGKGPMTAAHVCVEGVGPALFAGWARGGEVYDCRDHGCGCGWIYEYGPEEPMGTQWPTPLIQITAYSAEQTANVYDALRPMIELGPLSEVVPRTGEEFIRLPGGGRIDTVTSSNQSRLGQRVTFVPQDETGIWLVQNKMDKVATTQRRGLSGMSGRSAETTNAWDPSENSVAQKTYEAALRMKDIFRLHRLAPTNLSFRDRRDRRRILKHVYAGSHWVDLDSIEAEAMEIMLTDPAQAERFYGNRIVAGLGQWMEEEYWDAAESDQFVLGGTSVAVGFDGSESDDWTAIRCVTESGHHFTPTYGPNNRPAYWNPKEWGGSIPRGEVHAAMDAISKKYRMRRVYADPRDWESEIGDWSLKYGDEVVFEWHTYRIMQMHSALVQNYNDYGSGRSTHDKCAMTKEHVLNARKVAKPSDRYILGKPNQHRKIDLAMADTLAEVAAQDLHVEKGWGEPAKLTRVKGRTSAQ
jgi:hypothetical protein